MTTAVEAPKAKNSSSAASARSVTDIDLVRSYLRDIGRVPLLSHEQEITLGRQVQDLVVLENLEVELEIAKKEIEELKPFRQKVDAESTTECIRNCQD